MNKVLVFDMDGTIANLYGVDGWLADLRSYNPRPYVVANPLYDMDFLADILNTFKDFGWTIAVTTVLSKDSTKEYDNVVREAKKEWLAKYNFPYDEIHLVKYGTTKANCTRKLGGFQVLVDDNETVRKGWKLGNTIDANENIIDKLLDLLLDEM
jgi:hydroxymethylpyrimidine pyrophosphatase-like HAD family hydrolase